MSANLPPPIDSEALRTAGHRPKISAGWQTLAGLFSGRGAREGYLAAADQGALSLSNFLATVILARVSTPTEVGVYGVGFVALRLVRSVQEGLIVQPMNIIGAGMEEEEFAAYASGTSLLQLLLALAGSAAVALCGWYLTISGNDVAGPTLFSLWFAFLGWQLQEYLRRMLYTRGAVFNALVNTGLANFARLALMIYWAGQGRLNGIAGLNAIAWGSILALLPGLWLTRRYWKGHFPGLRNSWRRNWEYGRWILGGTMANFVSVEFYPVLTAGMISFAAAGAYRALQNLVAPIHLLLRATDTFLTPRAARVYQRQGMPALARILKLTYLISGVPILGILGMAMAFPTQLLRLLYGETYVEFSPAMVLMAIFYALWFSYWPLQTALKAARLTRPIFIANLVAMVGMFTIGIWAIYRWGVYGTIAGQALNALVVMVILWIAWGMKPGRQSAAGGEAGDRSNPAASDTKT